ncbi:MAG TPA: hypothetical protein VFB62_07655, partial [Polyangiaceae bacterium]|nr:hypothetical protein [Polyangiaceae bacterium]
MARTFVLLLVALSAAGCDTESCLDPLSRTCEPAYEPTFDNIFTNTLQPTCARSGSSCHAPEGAQNGVSFGTPDQAHKVLT